MKKTCLVLLGLLWCAALPAKNFELKSPDGRIALAIDVGERIAYTVRGDGIPLLEECRLGLRLDRGGTAGPLRLVRHRSGSIDRTFRPAVAYKFSEIRDRCNTLRLDFRGGWSVEFRAYDDGVAYRFLSDTEGPVEVLGEEFALRLPDASTAVLQQPGPATRRPTRRSEPALGARPAGWPCSRRCSTRNGATKSSSANPPSRTIPASS